LVPTANRQQIVDLADCSDTPLGMLWSDSQQQQKKTLENQVKSKYIHLQHSQPP
jgi:hypothetical protein